MPVMPGQSHTDPSFSSAHTSAPLYNVFIPVPSLRPLRSFLSANHTPSSGLIAGYSRPQLQLRAPLLLSLVLAALTHALARPRGEHAQAVPAKVCLWPGCLSRASSPTAIIHRHWDGRPRCRNRHGIAPSPASAVPSDADGHSTQSCSPCGPSEAGLVCSAPLRAAALAARRPPAAHQP